MLPEIALNMMAQAPFDFTIPDFWFPMLTLVLNVFYALSIRGYLIFVLIGFIIYTTTYVDGFGKFMVGAGLFLFFAGPLIITTFAQLATVEAVTFQTATTAWLGFFGMSDADMIFTIMLIGDAVGAICCLTGAILYFTKAAGDLETKGRSLMVRSLILFAILAYFHVTPYIV